MIDVGHNLKYGIIAEGVETFEQLNALQILKCDSIQGYYFSKPLDTDKMTSFLAKCSNNFAMLPKV